MKITIILLGSLTLAAIAQEQLPLNKFAPTVEKPAGEGESSQTQKVSWDIKQDIKRARWDIRYLEEANFEPPSSVSEADRASHMASKKIWLPRIAKATNLEMPEDLSVPGIAAFIAEARKRLGPEERPVDLSNGIGDPAMEAMVKNNDFGALVDAIEKYRDSQLGLRMIYAINDQCSGYSSFMIPLLEKQNPEFVAGMGDSETFIGAIQLKKALVMAIAKDLGMEEIENLTHPSVKAFIADARKKLKKTAGSDPAVDPASNPQAPQGGLPRQQNDGRKLATGKDPNAPRNGIVIVGILVALLGIVWLMFRKSGK